jgi:hypothetical protein
VSETNVQTVSSWPQYGMTQERWELVDGSGSSSPAIPLTAEEIDAGWHFCCEWDGLLANYNFEGFCTCKESE